MASRLTSTTIRMPSRSDSSRIAEMPSILFSLTRPAICSMSRALLTWNGSSVTTIDSRSPFFVLLDLRAPAHLQDAAARLVGVHDALPAEDDPARREVGAGHHLDEPGELGVRVVEEDDRRGAGLGEVVRRDLRRHADRDALGAVHEEVRELRGQDGRLLERAVVGQRPVDGLLVDVVAEHLLGEAREPDLGVAHRRRRVAVHRAEVALSVHERLATWRSPAPSGRSCRRSRRRRAGGTCP